MHRLIATGTATGWVDGWRDDSFAVDAPGAVALVE
jgi:hypothetical protein